MAGLPVISVLHAGFVFPARSHTNTCSIARGHARKSVSLFCEPFPEKVDTNTCSASGRAPATNQSTAWGATEFIGLAYEAWVTPQ